MQDSLPCPLGKNKLSLFEADSDNDEDVDLEDSENEESDNASLLSEISSSLSCSEDTGPPIADSLAECRSGNFVFHRAFLGSQQPIFLPPGERERPLNISPISRSGLNFAKKRSAVLVLDFLTMLHENGLSYSSVNTARSMLSSILQLDINSSIPVGQLPIVKRFMKGIYELRLSLPKYTATWDLSIVLNYF
ncbi:hypothetical protein ACROYT_G027988 [Oculina patagonica]